MHFNFDFSADQILWTLTFAGLLVLLVVLLGRDRVRRFPWFTAAMRHDGSAHGGKPPALWPAIAHRFQRRFSWYCPISHAIIALSVVVEMARRAFAGARRRTWMVAAADRSGRRVQWCVVEWGPWPSAKTSVGRFRHSPSCA